MAKFIKVRCENCNKFFLKDSRHYRENIKFGHNFYCSRKCEYKYKTRRKDLICENCGKKIERTLCAISPHNFCSRSCAAIIYNKKRPERNAKKIKCKNCGKTFKRWVTGNKKYCSMNCFNKVNLYRPEELLEIIKNTAKKLKRVPARREFFGGINKACIKFFGSWNKSVSEAGLVPNRSHDNRMYRRVNARAIDGHLCDSISEALIDNWFYKNKIPHKKDVHYPSTNHKADWAITPESNNIFIEYFGLANDSPRYDRSIKEKEKLCKKQNIPLIAIYPKDLYPKIHLDNNLKSKFKDYLSI
ncbi:MAG: hypothetical protein WC514_00470 [Candidatus Paceibacterota bacterium]